MFRRLLIANRGEVAVRIARAARDLGVVPIGVHSQADARASWLEAFEESVCIGTGPPEKSYLRASALVQAALQTGCSAVHPGWGFLAENARFAALCGQHGLTFVGPRPAVMDRMGLKWPAKRGDDCRNPAAFSGHRGTPPRHHPPGDSRLNLCPHSRIIGHGADNIGLHHMPPGRYTWRATPRARRKTGPGTR